MKGKIIETPLGPMMAMSRGNSLCRLEFLDRFDSTEEIVFGSTAPIESIERELALYFAGELKEFTTPLVLEGTDFHQRVMKELQKVSFGTTCSYTHLAKGVGLSLAFRAVAQANSRNRLAIVLPCHRVVYKGGGLGGYNGGTHRKEWLLNHEKKVQKC